MEGKSYEMRVGIFALLGVALFCLSIILLGGDKFLIEKTYDLRVRLPQVQGLGRGSVISLMGVPVGNVSTIRFISGSTDVEVVMTVDWSVRDRITEGSKASVKTQGALGDKYIYVDGGVVGGKPLEPDSLLETDKTPDFLDVIASKGAELGEVVQVIKEVRLLFENINRDGRSAKLMTNLVAATDNFNGLMTEARETMRAMRSEAISPMASVMKKIDRGQGTLGALVNDPTLHNKLSGFFGDTPRNRFLKPLIRDSIQSSEGQK